jgi:hypothetical protein
VNNLEDAEPEEPKKVPQRGWEKRAVPHIFPSDSLVSMLNHVEPRYYYICHYICHYMSLYVTDFWNQFQHWNFKDPQLHPEVPSWIFVKRRKVRRSLKRTARGPADPPGPGRGKQRCWERWGLDVFGCIVALMLDWC